MITGEYTLLSQCTLLSVMCYAKIMHWSKFWHWTFLFNVYEANAQWSPKGTHFQTSSLFFPSRRVF
jgi:hypothetical protein